MAGIYYDMTTYWEYRVDGVDYSSINTALADVIANGAGDGGLNRPVQILLSINITENVVVNGLNRTRDNFLIISGDDVAPNRPTITQVAGGRGFYVNQENYIAVKNIEFIRVATTYHVVRFQTTAYFSMRHCKVDSSDPTWGMVYCYNATGPGIIEDVEGIVTAGLGNMIVRGGSGVAQAAGGTTTRALSVEQRLNIGDGLFNSPSPIMIFRDCTINSNNLDIGYEVGCVVVENCTFYGGYLKLRTKHAKIHNNIFADVEYPIRIEDIEQATFMSIDNLDIDYNAYHNITSNHYGQWMGVNKDSWAAWQAAAGEANSFSEVDPDFEDEGAGDFRLKSTSDLRTDDTYKVPQSGSVKDILGNSRRANDWTNFGAYHYGFDVLAGGGANIIGSPIIRSR